MLFFLRGAARCLAWLGFSGIQRLARILGFLLWHCLPSRRREAVLRVREHLGVPEKEAVSIARASFAHSAMAFLELALIPKCNGLDDPRIRNTEGRADYLRMVLQKRPVVVCLAHFGSWELLASLPPAMKGRPLATVVRRHKNPAMNALIHELRRAHGMLSLDHRDAAARVLELLRQGGVAAFLVDHNCRAAEAVFLPFLGQTAAVNRGPALLAVRAKALVYSMFMERHDDGTYSIIMGKTLDAAELAGPMADRVRAVAEFYTREVEKQVQRKPEQWFWMHRRWKTQPKQDTRDPSHNSG